ncbi:MAG: toll/interleukin-1 receptor domain-containing protein [Lysobacter sp.]|nr:toll/interleukin-1 receptor domain-containing protein [Lysobacter sp.]
MNVAVRYWAFLSYSHADRQEAERLHRALEGYRIPARLVGRLGPFGAVPRRLRPIFRDRDELIASGHIGAVVEEALAASRAFIVLCSPAAAASPWVDAEILAFQRLQPQTPVLCVLLDGEPMASRKAGTAVQECLPPSLRAHFGSGIGTDDAAPVAVDLRPHGDGWHLGVQKLVAGLAGVPLDELVQRDAHRRHQRMAWLSMALAVIAVALGTMAVFARSARDEAQRQRVQAEGLVEFMLGDLRKKLEPVGRLDALDAVGTRALQYYDTQDPRVLDANALGRRSRALHMIGEISDRRGDMDDARAAFHRARDATAELLHRAPDDGQRVFDHSQSVYWVGYIDWQHGDAVAAEKAFVEYQRLAGRMHAIDPANEAWFAEVGYAHSNLGTLLKERGRVEEAIVEFQAARRVFASLVKSSPQDSTRLLDLAQADSWLSSSYADSLRFIDALHARTSETPIYRDILAREPRNAVATERMMVAHRLMANLYRDQGDLDAASREAAEAERLVEIQLRLDPDNTDWMKSAAKTRLLQAELLRLQGNSGQALVALERARSVITALMARDSAVWAWRVELQEEHAQIESDLLRSQGNRDAALQTIAASTSRLAVIAEEPGQRGKSNRWLALSAGREALLRTEAGDRIAARERWQTVVDAFAARGEAALDGEALAWLARAEAALGKTEHATRLTRKLRGAGYRHPDFIGATALRPSHVLTGE